MFRRFFIDVLKGGRVQGAIGGHHHGIGIAARRSRLLRGHSGLRSCRGLGGCGCRGLRGLRRRTGAACQKADGHHCEQNESDLSFHLGFLFLRHCQRKKSPAFRRESRRVHSNADPYPRIDFPGIRLNIAVRRFLRKRCQRLFSWFPDLQHPRRAFSCPLGEGTMTFSRSFCTFFLVGRSVRAVHSDRIVRDFHPIPNYPACGKASAVGTER